MHAGRVPVILPAKHCTSPQHSDKRHLFGG